MADGSVQASAAVWHGQGDVRVETRHLPLTPPPGWVRLRVAWCGICGSDATELLRGPVVIPTRPHPLTGARAPLVLGHEFAGYAVAAGRTEPFPPETRLVTDTLHGCGSCAACVRGEVNLCPDLAVAGLSMDGGLATHVDVPADSCVVVPDELSLDVAALAEPLAVAERAVANAGLQGDEHVVVLGAGPVGALIAVLLSDVLTGRIECVERLASRRAFVDRVSGTSAVERLDELDIDQFDIDGPRLVLFECTGQADALNEAIGWLPVLARIVLVGVHGPRTPIDLNTLLHREMTLAASLSHSRADFLQAVERLTDSPARFGSFITTRVGLTDAPNAIAALASSSASPGKTLVDVEGGSWTT